MYQIRIEHHRNGFSFFVNGKSFRRKKDAEAYKRLHYKNSACTVQVVRC